MRKWLTRIFIITLVIGLAWSHHDALDTVVNFVIDGVIPLTNKALGDVASFVVIVIMSLAIYYAINDLRHDMLRRRAFLYRQLSAKNKLSGTNTSMQTSGNSLSLLNETDDGELVRPLA